jgi:hypothetical protein
MSTIEEEYVKADWTSKKGGITFLPYASCFGPLDQINNIYLFTPNYFFSSLLQQHIYQKPKKLLQQWSIFFGSGILLESYNHIYNGFKT